MVPDDTANRVGDQRIQHSVKENRRSARHGRDLLAWLGRVFERERGGPFPRARQRDSRIVRARAFNKKLISRPDEAAVATGVEHAHRDLIDSGFQQPGRHCIVTRNIVAGGRSDTLAIDPGRVGVVDRPERKFSGIVFPIRRQHELSAQPNHAIEAGHARVFPRSGLIGFGPSVVVEIRI